MALFLDDILTVLQKVSMKFQEEGSVVADVSLTMRLLKDQLLAQQQERFTS